MQDQNLAELRLTLPGFTLAVPLATIAPAIQALAAHLQKLDAQAACERTRDHLDALAFDCDIVSILEAISVVKPYLDQQIAGTASPG